MYGAGVDAQARARHWLTVGPKLVIISRGGDGASVCFGNSTFDLPVRKVNVIDTVGTGDSLHAARRGEHLPARADVEADMRGR